MKKILLKNSLTDRKVSINTFMEETKPINMDKDAFEPRDTTKSKSFFGFSGPIEIRRKDQYPRFLEFYIDYSSSSRGLSIEPLIEELRRVIMVI